MVLRHTSNCRFRGTTRPRKPKDDNKVTTGDAKPSCYRSLTDAFSLVNKMSWQDVNTKIYGVEGLTAADFWDNYEPAYDVKVTAVALNATTTTDVLTATARATPRSLQRAKASMSP